MENAEEYRSTIMNISSLSRDEGNRNYKSLSSARDSCCNNSITRILIDASSILKLGEEITKLCDVGFKPVVISTVLWERKNLLNSAERQIKGSFYFGLLSGVKVIDANRLDIQERAREIYRIYKGKIDSPYKHHNIDDADFSQLACAKMENIPIIVTEDSRLRLVAKKLGLRVINADTLMREIRRRERGFEKQKEKEATKRAEKKELPTVTCPHCGRKVELKNLHKHVLKAHCWKTISTITCTNVGFLDSKSQKQTIITQKSNESTFISPLIEVIAE